MKSTAIILAAGHGRRFGSETPKQFVDIHDAPLLWYSMNSFNKFDSDIRLILVLDENHMNTWKQICIDKQINITHEVISGGKSRSESVKNALNSVSNEGFVFIHDAARPCLSIELIERIKRGVIEHSNVIPVIPENNAIRIKEGKSYSYLNRDEVVLIQTPQGFLAENIKMAYDEYYRSNAKDDAEIAEESGMKIHHVDGDLENIKVTFPIDLELAEVILGKRKNERETKH